MSSAVSRIPAAPSQQALAYFEQLMSYESDCWDVHHAIVSQRQDFILIDVRGEALFDAGHVAGSVNIPHQKLTSSRLEHYPSDTLFVVYCAGPHCNATEKAAVRLAKLDKPVKKMIGGVTGWLDEGFELVTSIEKSNSDLKTDLKNALEQGSEISHKQEGAL